MIYENWIQKCLSDGISQDSISKKDKLFNELTAKIDCTNKKLLLVGSVQSGKTSTYIGLISKLFDKNQSNLVILFCGVSNILKAQTVDRMRKAFKDIDDITIRTSERGNYDYSEVINDLNKGKKVILLSIKHYMHIEEIAKWFNNSQPFFNNPVIIDDEGDQASFYNLVKYSQEGVDSATYNAFRGFFKQDNCCTFISVTATPYAHIMVHKEWYAMEPDYAFLIPDGEGYLSYSKLNSHREIFKLLTDEDIAEMQIEKDEFDEYQLMNLPFSAKAAIIQYFISHYLYKNDIRKGISCQSQMIINIDRRIRVHYSAAKILQDFLDDFEYKPSFREKVINYLYSTKTKEEKLTLESIALKIIENHNYELRIINCANEMEHGREIEPQYFTQECNVIIGGITIGRGVSFPTLLSFYYVNEKQSYTIDNTIQVCRFLGYREKVLPYYSLWLTRRMQDVLETIFDADDRIRERISYYENNDKSFKEFTRGIKITVHSNADYGILATRKTVAKQVATDPIQSLYNDTYFDFKSDDDEMLNNQMQDILNTLISSYTHSKNQITSASFGKDFENYPVMLYSSFKNFVDEMDHSIKGNTCDILRSYFKVAIYSKDVIDMLMKSDIKVIVALMLYKFDNKTGKFEPKQILYHKDRKEFSYYRVGYRSNYIGDNNWAYQYKLYKNEDAVVVQFFVLETPAEYKTTIFDKDVVKMQIVLPTGQTTQDAIIYAEDEKEELIQEDQWLK